MKRKRSHQAPRIFAKVVFEALPTVWNMWLLGNLCAQVADYVCGGWGGGKSDRTPGGKSSGLGGRDASSGTSRRELQF